MKTIIEETNEGLEKLLGEQVLIFCVNYNYTGKLTGVNNTCIKLSNPHIVFETGSFSDEKFETIESLNTDSHYIQNNAIESFGITKKVI